MNVVNFKPWNAAVYLLSLAVLLQASLGELFYKQFLSEAFILLAWLGILPLVLSKYNFPYAKPVFHLIGLSLIYFFYSLFMQRELYWVIRQSAFMLYASIALFSFEFVNKNWGSGKVERLFHLAGIAGVFLAIVQPIYLVSIGERIFEFHFTAMLLLLVGLSYWVQRAPSFRKKMAYSIGGIAYLFFFTTHTMFVVAALVILWLSIWAEFKRHRIVLLLISFLILPTIMLLVFVTKHGIDDPNATWRFVYWAGVIQESWDRGWFLLGKGFGVQYMPADSEDFLMLIEQVSGESNREYQLMSVPPHNGLLTILIYIGIVGVIIFCWPLIKAMRLILAQKMDTQAKTFVISTFGMFVLLINNQFLETPYTAVIFWLVYGGMLASISRYNTR